LVDNIHFADIPDQHNAPENKNRAVQTQMIKFYSIPCLILTQSFV